ncbi:hypothetical protein EOA13_37635, partial [Mesorhizobium sp. M7A.F.Ca.US.011.01.1.1]|uniref:hypothetical protein n=1 Tax=Mesorhizobium sp. M7A.F.Ca.US.011.01.1.1 TaxID=2496741 RepID=UPI000FD4A1D4
MLGLTLVSVTLSMSRTSLFIAVMFAGFLLSIRLVQSVRLAFAGGAALLLVPCVILVLEHGSSLDISGQLIESWKGRFSAGTLSATYEYAMAARNDEFAEDWQHAQRNNLLVGEGFGHYHLVSPSGYSNSHNLFLMEWFENG